jgi:hypothetical protein
MIRSIRIAIAVAAAAALTVAIAGPSLAATSKASLSSTEYTQLTAEQVAFKKLEHKKRLTWNDIYAACHKVGQSTALLRSVRANCETGVGIDQSLDGFYADVERCAALSGETTTTGTGTTTTATGTTTTGTGTTTTPTGTTTTGTGTTTTPTGTTTTGTGTTTTGSGDLTPVELKLFACLEPEYAVISRAAKSVYEGQAGLRTQVLARGFAGRCLFTLAPTTAQLKTLKRFVTTSRQLSADVSLITKVANGHAPASAINDKQVESDSASFSAAGKAFEKLHRPQKLSVCSHQ